MKKIKKILIIIQRSNGDVFLSYSLIKSLQEHFKFSKIDLLVNDDTISVANLIPKIDDVITFSYQRKKEEKIKQEFEIISKIYRKYDLSINLTASDRSVLYSILASRKSISAIEKNSKKSWWKKTLLHKSYYFDFNKHILLNNIEPLRILKINHTQKQEAPKASKLVRDKVKARLKKLKIKDFIIVHFSAQYSYKIYSRKLSNDLLHSLNSLNISLLITGGKSEIDLKIKEQIPNLPNIFDLIGETTLEEYLALSDLSVAYIGMDTLNMHIAAAQDKRIFAIFGPTNLRMWSPWSNILQKAAYFDAQVQTYGKNSIFQANMPCVACGKAGCDDLHGESKCLSNINPNSIFKEFKYWYINQKNNIEIETELNSKNQNPGQKRKIVLYIVYGEDEGYYNGAKFSFLTLMNWYKSSDSIRILILTEKPEKFLDYPVEVIKMSKAQKMEWSVNGKYHFRIKNRGMAFVMDKLNLSDNDKILFFDADTYFHKSPMKLFELINHHQAVLYLNEGLINKRKRFKIYQDTLGGKIIEYDGHNYELSSESAMWGSLMIGLMPNMRKHLEWADKLLLKFLDILPAHTIEEFSLSETLLKKYEIKEGKNYVGVYSTSRKKLHAEKIIKLFFNKYSSHSIIDQIEAAQRTKIKRSLITIIKQRFF